MRKGMKMRKIDLEKLLKQASEKVASMTSEEKEEMLKAQRESWVRGELGMMEPKPKFKIVNGVKVYESCEDFWND